MSGEREGGRGGERGRGRGGERGGGRGGERGGGGEGGLELWWLEMMRKELGNEMKIGEK